MSLLLTSVRNAVSEAFQRLPRLVALFAAEAVTIQVKSGLPFPPREKPHSADYIRAHLTSQRKLQLRNRRSGWEIGSASADAT